MNNTNETKNPLNNNEEHEKLVLDLKQDIQNALTDRDKWKGSYVKVEQTLAETERKLRQTEEEKESLKRENHRQRRIELDQKETKQGNEFLTTLTQKIVQERVLKLIHANNPFQIFAKTNIEYNGAFGEYIGTQPLEGVKWKKELTGEDFKKLPIVFSCRLPIMLDNVYPSIQNKQVMKRALQSPALMAELSERLIDDIKTQATRDIKKKVLEKLCPTDPTEVYHDNAITK
ncbi:20233_t:CDS:2 [Entrophospora sp. SA101]|nr:13022_t:CDS:2 [Entrophospora sp. SA101]CAJ0747881.1 20233_t:CDS:2 [Entrophospora sp. SA101]CAJ0824357.1 6880_t:CDS:2 [Entrophospora sp. SA101]CAJ0847621.1 2835_t:CDS:2 [Entrophospora sp. SA101]